MQPRATGRNVEKTLSTTPATPQPPSDAPVTSEDHSYFCLPALTHVQLQAIQLLLVGHSPTAVARKLSLHRATLWRWSNYHPLFIAELNRRRKELAESSRQQLQSLLRRSLKILKDNLSSDDPQIRLRSARAILSHCAPRHTGPDSSAPCHPNDIIDPIAQDLRREVAGNSLDFVPIGPHNRREAEAWLLQQLTSPPNPFDPPDTNPPHPAHSDQDQ